MKIMIKAREIIKLYAHKKNELSIDITFFIHRTAVYKFKTLLFSLWEVVFEKTFQNLNVSSPAPVTIASPSGDSAKYKTLYECPVNLATLYKKIRNDELAQLES